MNNLIICKNCGKPYPDLGTPYRCECGGVFDIGPTFFDKQVEVDENLHGMWKYKNSFTLEKDSPEITLGEGNTPLVEIPFKGRKVFLKLEYQNPTGSYKDRGTSVLASFLKSRGVNTAAEDSSGNAGASFAAYAARTGISARVFVPESASGPKRSQIEAYGAELIRVPGPRIEATKAVMHAVEQGIAYGSHAYMPFGLSGIATISYEIVEQLGRTPGTVISPIGHGGLLYGMMIGFQKMKMAKQINQEPFYLGVQSAGCAPVEYAYANHISTITNVEESATVAEGVRVSHPMRGEAILSHLHQTQGKIIKIIESEILEAYYRLGKLGFFVEPTSALAWAGMVNHLESLPDPIILILTGSGLKTKSF